MIIMIIIVIIIFIIIIGIIITIIIIIFIYLLNDSSHLTKPILFSTISILSPVCALTNKTNTISSNS